MKLRQVVALALVAVAVGACKKKQPPVAAPTTTAAVDSASIRQARADSIAAAERAVRERAVREQAAAVARARETLADVVYFEFDSDQLTQEAQEKLQVKAAIMRANPGLQIQIAGHADQRGSTEYNLALGQRRAESVRDFLSGYGITADRVSTISYGEERPAVEGDGEESWLRNRRAEFAITGGDIATVPGEVR